MKETPNMDLLHEVTRRRTNDELKAVCLRAVPEKVEAAVRRGREEFAAAEASPRHQVTGNSNLRFV